MWLGKAAAVAHLFGGVEENGEVDELAVSLDEVAQGGFLQVPTWRHELEAA